MYIPGPPLGLTSSHGKQGLPLQGRDAQFELLMSPSHVENLNFALKVYQIS